MQWFHHQKSHHLNFLTDIHFLMSYFPEYDDILDLHCLVVLIPLQMLFEVFLPLIYWPYLILMVQLVVDRVRLHLCSLGEHEHLTVM